MTFRELGLPPGRWLFAGFAFIFLAISLPVDTLAAWMVTARPDQELLGLAIFRLCLALEGVLLLVRAVLPADWFRGPGLPAAVTGLCLGAEGEPGARQRWSWRPLGALVAIGTALRLIGLNRDLWLDEISTVLDYLRLRPWEVLYTYHSPNQHLLYSVLGSASLHLFGESPWAVRLPAVLFGAGGVVAMYYLARAVTSERETLLATAFLALSYHHVWFSQNARGYTGMIFWSALGTGLFLRGLAWNRASTWAGYVTSMTLGIMTLQNTAFVFLGQVAIYGLILFRRPDLRTRYRGLTRRVLASVVLAGVLSLQAHSLILPAVVEFFRTADRTGLGSGVSSPWGLFGLLLQGLRAGFAGPGVALVLLLMGMGGWSYRRQSLLIAGLMVLPPVFGIAAVLLLNYGAFPRLFLYALPPAILLAVRGGMALGEGLGRRLVPAGHGRTLARAHLGTAIVALLVSLSAVSLVWNYRYPKQDYTGALAYVNGRKAPGDRVSAIGMAAAVYHKYYAPEIECPKTPAELAALRGRDHAVWVLYSFPRDMRLRFPEIYDYVEARSQPVAAFRGTLGDGTVYVARVDGADY
ncbi:MAG TPA: glycosyltransferase family 39 protein [Thermoanaerobaculia bacterium]|jgi:4-amino-4-deoxy-L-arabinose transferase-like glycosyltransferase|nr:glycosyltransferase family 39 protein [Thermoanaerobaculia bacterium]